MADWNRQAELYAKYAPLIYSRCRRFLRTEDEAQEATGDLFRNLLAEWETVRAGGDASGWIARATARKCLSALRRERAWTGCAGIGLAEDERFEGVGEEGVRVIEALAARPASPQESGTREVAMLAWWEGMPADRIARVTGMTEDGVACHLERARAWAPRSAHAFA